MPNQPIVTAGLVLRETVTRETDKILTVLTPDRGKISLIARGARRKNSRLAAACQLLAYSELTIYEKGQWFMLDEAETLELFTGLRTDFVALSLASYLADLTDATAQAEDTSQLLRLLLNALYALSVLHKPPQLVKPAFELRLMALSGFEPLADGCAVCGRPEPEDPVLDAVHGVVCCAACREKGGLAMPLSPAALAALRHVLYCPDKKLYSFTLDTPALRQLGQADVSTIDVIQNLFPDKQTDFVISINETDVALIKQLPEGADAKELQKIAKQISTAVNQELGIKVGLIRPITLWPFPEAAFAQAQQLFGEVQRLHADGETAQDLAFVTPVMPEERIDEQIAAFTDAKVVSRIRVADF